MRRTLLAAAAMLAMGCGAATAQTRWTMATAYAEGNFHTRNIRAFIEDVERSTERSPEHPVASRRIPSADARHQARRADRPGATRRGAALGPWQRGPVLRSGFVPFLADTWEATAALDRASMPFIAARMDRQGVLPLFAVPWPSQAFYTRSEVRTAEDLRGLRFRTYNVLTTRMAELLGAAPVTVQVAEIPQAFATGVIAAMFTSAQTGVDTSAWDYARYFMDVGGMRARNFIIVNARAFRGLDEATRTAVVQAAGRAAVRGLEASKAAEIEMVERLRARGMQVSTPSPQFLAQLREVGARQTQEWAQRAGPDGQQLLDSFRSAAPR